MTTEQKAKAAFVSKNLKPLLQDADGKIRNVAYITAENGRATEEIVMVVREQRDFTEKQIDINVTGDSLKAITKDVVRKMAEEWRI